ncbi:transcription factor domain-containing protein [Aspergillus clavatus NRRL 1]|uniref:Xylanolytic transcriptional activator regulatory domain-containing protein n=1 Tax=Aspergillus clavatus (strain ATCC 1007 / CBS 513.65 / DSM 816 / NCTC 3887 / NRRL 1 / QM 1276 / 107) TaxID=344612 RepID=A1CA84_ASPCL|nr:uncharacterized protein ACLA_010780 [Aspergillus clavatus NRRL 1]EAW12652.1 conserved hypothetical protein [Aspergillus clavatus NRRL 1]
MFLPANMCSGTDRARDLLTRHQKTCKARHSPLSEYRARPVAQAERLQPRLPMAPMALALVGPESSMLLDQPSSLDFAAWDSLHAPPMASDSITTGEKLEYLADFTRSNGMATFLDYETLKQRQKLLLDCSESHLTDHPAVTVDPALHHQPCHLDPLTLKTHEITHCLQHVISNKFEKVVIKLDWAPDVQASCEAFYTPRNIRRFLEYFWALWYPNCPIVHRPSFDPLGAPVALLCVMVLIGACLSPYEDDGHAARMWLDGVEELAFCNGCFHEESGKLMVTVPRLKSRVESLQTAYLVCWLQKREGSVEAQGRVRRHRHAVMVTVARDIGIESATHRNLWLTDPSENWWRQFAIEEALIRHVPHSVSTTLTYVFLIDAATAIFHHTPPRMVVSELQMDMSCPEPCFQADSAIECFNLLRGCEGSTFWSARLSVAEVARRICQGELDEQCIHEYSTMGTLNLFTTVQALHSLLMIPLQNSPALDSTLAPVQIGLDNWRRMWIHRRPEDRRIPDQPRCLWKKIGVVRYAPGVWHLARSLLARMTASAMGPIPESSRQGPARDGHTDMTDVNGLIMEYQQLNLDASSSF